MKKEPNSKSTKTILNKPQGGISLDRNPREKASKKEDPLNIMRAVRDYIFEHHRFPQINDIAEATDIQSSRCNEVVDMLIKERDLYVAFEGRGLPRIILPYDMMQELLMTQKKPEWLTKYGFQEKAEISKKVEELQKDAIKYEQFERLLFAADIPLEEAIAYSLQYLGFENVVHQKDDPNNPDVTFEYKGVKALLEAEGTTKQGDKRKILQLDGWMQKALNNGARAAGIKGFFVVNHFRDLEPGKREDPLTPHAKEFLQLYRFTFFTTVFLFDLVKQVLSEEKTKHEVQDILWGGEKLR